MYEEDKWEKRIRKQNEEGDIVMWQSPEKFAKMMTKIRVIRKIRGCSGVGALLIISEQFLAKVEEDMNQIESDEQKLKILNKRKKKMEAENPRLRKD